MMLVGLNVFFSWYTWKLADERFSENENFSGWLYIALSALNAAAAMVHVL